jgi:hypothetical protein
MGVFRAMLAKNKPIEEIEEFTGLSKEEIGRIWKKL